MGRGLGGGDGERVGRGRWREGWEGEMERGLGGGDGEMGRGLGGGKEKNSDREESRGIHSRHNSSECVCLLLVHTMSSSHVIGAKEPDQYIGGSGSLTQPYWDHLLICWVKYLGENTSSR